MMLLFTTKFRDLVQCVSTLLLVAYVAGDLSDVTSKVFGDKPVAGILAAFGDFNGDKATDVFVLTPDGKSVYILEADIDIRRDGTELTEKRGVVAAKYGAGVISSVVPSDFNSDSQMDVLVTRKVNSGETTEVTVEIYTPGDTSEPYLTLSETLRDQPAVIDWNGDMIPDLFGETSDGQRAVWIFTLNGTCTLQHITKPGSTDKLPPLKVPQSSAFVDLNGDLTPDLCAVTSENNKVVFEFWLNIDGNLTLSRQVPAPEELKVVGQASFVDFSGNHETSIVLPGCLDDVCAQSAVFVWDYDKYSATTGKWYKLPINFNPSPTQHSSFVKVSNPTSWLTLPLTLRMGDFNRDGYPDAVALLSETKEGKTNITAYLMINVECSGEDCAGFSRTLSIDYGQPLQRHKPALASFFDLMENGALDVLLTETKEDGSLVIRAIKQDFNGDASFLKVLVTSGLCHDNCQDNRNPYGVNQAGPSAKFETTTDSGGTLIGAASQLTQSSYMALQLPYMLFGLGRTPNFIDDLEVGIQTPNQNPRRHSWNTIIPNSQVIVIPYPPDNPSNWKHELYVMPSRLMLLTGASLLGTCVFMAVIIGLLQWRERLEDKKEKLQESQRFHFDAM